jgi:hypothetical protein
MRCAILALVVARVAQSYPSLVMNRPGFYIIDYVSGARASKLRAETGSYYDVLINVLIAYS